MKLYIEQLRYTYRSANLEDNTVLDVPEWEVESGCHVLLRGISGSGKTTLFNVLAGLLPPLQGAVWIGEQRLYDLSESKRDRFRACTIGYIFQIHLLAPAISALENVEMPLVFAGERSGSQRRRLAAEMLDQVGLAGFERHRPAQLSTGQRLRVAVARALVGGPRLLLADEPTAALDESNAVAVMDLLQTRCRQQGATLLVASHDPALAPRFDVVYDLKAGHLHNSSRPEVSA